MARPHSVQDMILLHGWLFIVGVAIIAGQPGYRTVRHLPDTAGVLFAVCVPPAGDRDVAAPGPSTRAAAARPLQWAGVSWWVLQASCAGAVMADSLHGCIARL